MGIENAISVRNVSKTFTTRADSTREGKLFKKSDKIIKNVLSDVNIEIKKGEAFGIIGRNGSGKSTLLKIISRIMKPDSGTVETSGRVGSILELGMGFHQDLSGKENIYIKGSMYGFAREQIDEKFDDIVKYAELEDYIDLPIRVYSTGMVSRLAFAIMINVDADILILDEVLSTGDLAFSKKSGAHFSNMKSLGKTIVIVSHSIATIKSMCDRVAWIDNGRLREIGAANVVCGHYETELAESFDVIKELAESGVPSSQNTLGCMYRDGNKIQKNTELAVFWFEEAVKRDDDDAKINLADMVVSGTITRNHKEVLELYMSAAKKGNQDARNKLSRLLTKEKNDVGREIAEDFKKLLPSGSSQIFYEYADLLMKTAWNNEDRSEALLWFRKAAEKGNKEAMYQIALMYRDGRGPKQNDSEYINWLKKAADNEHAQSQLTLGKMYLDGIKVESDEKEAFYWYEKSAKNNNLDAIYQVAMMYRDGTGIENDKCMSGAWLKKYFEHGLYRQINTLADSFSHHKNGVNDPNVGTKWYSVNADHNIAEPEYQIGLLLMADKNDKMFKESVSFLRSAANKGHLGSAIQLLNLYGLDLVDRPLSNCALEAIDSIIKSGNAWAAHLVGSMYADGKIVEPNSERAIRYLNIAANMAIPASLQKLGEMYRDGILIDQNTTLAVEYFKRGVMAGNVWSAVSLINMYGAGTVDRGVLDFSMNELENLCLKGDIVAMRTLGSFHRNGIAMKIDSKKALKWLSKASEFGDAASKHMIGEMYRDGMGVGKNTSEALKWFVSAADQGYVHSLLTIVQMYDANNPSDFPLEYTLKRLEKMANGGNIIAIRNLGNIYLEGKIVSKNVEEAKKWFERSTMLGDSFSRNILMALK